MRVRLPIAVTLSMATLLSSCTSTPSMPSPSSSTTGTIVTRIGQVTEVHENVGKTGVQTAAEILVQFENGDIRRYDVERSDDFHLGDQVAVTTANGVTRITRTEHPRN